MDNNGLQQQIANMRQSFFDERLLNRHFVLLEELEECDNPNFVENMLRTYFTHNAGVLTKVEEQLEKTCIDFPELDRLLVKFKGSSGTVGANRVTTKVAVLRQYLKAGNIEYVKVVFHYVKRDQENLKNKLETYFQLKKLVSPAETPELPKSEDQDDDNELWIMMINCATTSI